MVAVVNNGAVIALGDYTQEQYPDFLIVEVTQEQYEFIQTCFYPQYDGVNFFDISDEEKQLMMFDTNSGNEAAMIPDRIIRGQTIWNTFFARLRILTLMGSITEVERRLRLDVADHIRKSLFNGDFELAKSDLIELGSTVITQSLYDEMLNSMIEFMNYSYTDHGIVNVSLLRKSNEKSN